MSFVCSHLVAAQKILVLMSISNNKHPTERKCSDIFHILVIKWAELVFAGRVQSGGHKLG